MVYSEHTVQCTYTVYVHIFRCIFTSISQNLNTKKHYFCTGLYFRNRNSTQLYTYFKIMKIIVHCIWTVHWHLDTVGTQLLYNKPQTQITRYFQGLLKLEHCFTPPKNADAEVIEVQAGDKKMKIVMAPGWPFLYGGIQAYILCK